VLFLVMCLALVLDFGLGFDLEFVLDSVSVSALVLVSV
jgi:hypothetical protein